MEAEDSMEEISPVFMQTVSGGDQVDMLLSQAVNISNDNMAVHEPTCIICSSPYREEIEKFFLDSKTLSQDNLQKTLSVTVAFCKEKFDLKVNKDIIENHMRFHHDKVIQEIQKIEYIDRIKRYSGQNLTTLDRISICFAIISERLMGINSVIPSTGETFSQIEKMKSAETARLMGILNNLLKLQAGILGEMKSSGELISIPANDFVRIINKALSEAQTDRERKMVKYILDSFDALSRKSQ
jgi:hypothetical protein